MPKLQELNTQCVFIKKNEPTEPWINHWTDKSEEKLQSNKTRFMSFLKENYGDFKLLISSLQGQQPAEGQERWCDCGNHPWNSGVKIITNKL